MDPLTILNGLKVLDKLFEIDNNDELHRQEIERQKKKLN